MRIRKIKKKLLQLYFMDMFTSYGHNKSQNKITDFFMLLAWDCPFNDIKVSVINIKLIRAYTSIWPNRDHNMIWLIVVLYDKWKQHIRQIRTSKVGPHVVSVCASIYIQRQVVHFRDQFERCNVVSSMVHNRRTDYGLIRKHEEACTTYVTWCTSQYTRW